MKKRPAKKKPGKKAGAKISFNEKGWIAQIKEFKKKRDPYFSWGTEMLLALSNAEGFKKRQALTAQFERKLKLLYKEGNQEALRAVVASFISLNQGELMRSTLKFLEISGWADRIPDKKI